MGAPVLNRAHNSTMQASGQRGRSKKREARSRARAQRRHRTHAICNQWYSQFVADNVPLLGTPCGPDAIVTLQGSALASCPGLFRPAVTTTMVPVTIRLQPRTDRKSRLGLPRVWTHQPMALTVPRDALYTFASSQRQHIMNSIWDATFNTPAWTQYISVVAEVWPLSKPLQGFALVALPRDV